MFGRQPDLKKKFVHPAAPLMTVEHAVGQPRFADDPTDRLAGINGSEWILKDDLEFPTRFPHLLFAQLEQITPVK